MKYNLRMLSDWSALFVFVLVLVVSFFALRTVSKRSVSAELIAQQLATAEPSAQQVVDQGPKKTLIRTAPSALHWDVIYDGNGRVSFDATSGILFEPKPPKGDNETLSTLLLAKDTVRYPLRNFEVSIKVATERQLRSPTPNDWEAFWLFFNYNPTGPGTKDTNYFVFKPSGLELGVAFEVIGQKFLQTIETPRMTIGKPYTIKLRKMNKAVSIYIDDLLAMNYEEKTGTGLLYDRPGSIGIYSEDARVHVYSMQVTEL